MLCLEVEKEELIMRLLSRGKVSGRVDDQNQKVIENRIKVYQEKTEPIIEYFKPQNKHHGINGMGSIDDIAGRIKEVVAKLQA